MGRILVDLVPDLILRQHPELLPATIADAKLMAEALDGVWTHLNRIVQTAGQAAAQS
jgi:hypothetical protein